ncbi:MAG: aspartyl protease family protein [Gemmatimonadota bacterium]
MKRSSSSIGRALAAVLAATMVETGGAVGLLAQHSAAAMAGLSLGPQAIDMAMPRVVVPLELVLGGRAAVRAMVNGYGPFLFAIETGSPFVVVTERTAGAAHLTKPGLQSHHPWPGGTTPHGFTVDSLRIGDAVWLGQPVVTGPDFLPGVDGLLGLPAYAGVLMTVDYPGRRVVFERSALPEPDGREVFEALTMDAHIGITIEIDGQHVPAVIDTQGGTDLTVPPALASSLRFASTPVIVGQAKVGDHPPTPLTAARLDGDVRIGGFTISRPIVNVIPTMPGETDQVVLGIGLLRHFSVTLDQKNRRVRLQSTERTIPLAPSIRMIGLGLGSAPDNGVFIVTVTPSGAAEAAGVQAGDVVVEIGGRPARDFLAPSELTALVQRGDPIRFELTRSGRRLALDVTPIVKVL